jgi:hypothetical protein
VQDNPLVTSGVTISPSSTNIGQPVTATMTIRNSGSAPVNIGSLIVAARDPSGNNVDFPADDNVTIAAGSTYTYSKSQTFSSAGKYSFFIADLRNSVWDRNYPKSADGSVIRLGNFIIIP